MAGKSYRRQIGSQKLADELRSVFLDPHPSCLVGIPTMDPAGPKFANWDRHRERFIRLLEGTQVEQYYSAFISRPDSAPWINVPEFAERMQSLWANKRAVVLCEPQSSLLKLVLRAAGRVDHVPCPSRQAYDEIDSLELDIARRSPEIILMSCGPTATCLANRFARHGVQALDLGSAGGFLLKLLA